MVALSASELLKETLQAGELIKYHLVAFVTGDPRAHRFATVFRIQIQARKFCIDIDTGDNIPLWMMIKRYASTSGKRVKNPKRRKLRTFTFVTGSVDLPTPADHLRGGLDNALPAAEAAVRARLARSSCSERLQASRDTAVNEMCLTAAKCLTHPKTNTCSWASRRWHDFAVHSMKV